MKPPRASSLWLTASASAGSSRSVGKNSLEARAITVVAGDYSSGISEASAIAASLAMPLKRPRGLSARPLNPLTWRRIQRNQRGLRHGKRGRLRHLQALRAVHAALDPAVDLVEELVDQDVRRDLLQHAAMRVDEADVAAARDPEIGVARLARPVDGAAHDRDLEGLRVGAQPLLDLHGELLDADVVAAAARARDHDRPALAQPERLENL